MPIHQTTTSRIRELRQQTGLTQAQLAAFVQVSTTTVQNWEADKGLEQIERMLKLCAILDCNLDDLIEEVPGDGSATAGKKQLSIEDLRQIGASFRGNITSVPPNPGTLGDDKPVTDKPTPIENLRRVKQSM